MANWNYAQLSKLASQLGGPEEMIRLIKKSGVTRGRLEMLPLAFVLAAFSSGITWYMTYKSQKVEEESQLAESNILRMTASENNNPEDVGSSDTVNM